MRQKIKILIVEDEIIIGSDLKNRVEALGYESCGTVTSGEMAVQLTETEHPDLVLMDIILGKGMDGIEAAGIIRERFNTPVVFMTAYADEDRLKRAKLTQPFGYIMKPFQDRELKITIEMALYAAQMDLDRKKAEEALRTSEERHKAILQTAMDGYWLVDMQGRILEVNDAYCRMHGSSREELLARNITDVEAVETPAETYSYIRKVMEQGEGRFESRHRRKDGAIIDVEISAKYRPDEGGQVVVFLRDITERKRAEENLKASEERYRKLVDEAPNSITVVQDGKYVFANPCASRIKGFGSPDDMIGVSVLETIAEEFREQMIPRLKNIEMGKRNDPIELKTNGKRGRFFWIESVSIPIQFNDQAAALVISNDITGRKQAEESLKESEEKYRTLLESAPSSIFVMQDDKFVFANPYAAKLRNYDSPGEMIGKTVLDTVAPEYHDVIKERRKNIERGKRNEPIEIRMFGKHGEIIWVESVSVPIRFNHRNATLVIANDITERKLAEDELRSQRDALNKVFESLPFVLLLVNDELRVEQINRAGVQFTGRPREELLGLLGGEIFGCLNSYDGLGCGRNPECDTCPVRCKVVHTMQSGEAIHNGEGKITVLKGSETHTLDLLISTSRLRLGDAEKVLVTIADVTERKRMEEALRESEDKFRKAYHTSPDAININRLEDGLYVDINQGFTQLTGFTREDVIGRTSGEIRIWHDPADRRRLIEGLRDKGCYENLEAKFRKKDGSLTTALMSARIIALNGTPHILSITRDISERLTLEEQLRQALKMEAVGTLAGGIAHDFNNLTQAVIGYAQLLLLEKEENSSEYRDLTAIYRAGERASQLVRQLMTFSRKVEGDRRTIRLNQIIRETASLLERTIPKMIEIQVDLADNLWLVNADPVQIEQILLNLGSNAADAMPDGGRFIVRTSNVTLDEAFCRHRRDLKPGPYVLLDVTDTGEGMDHETIQKIFDPFFTTKGKGKGTGLGLASVYGIVRGHGGYIYCDSTVGQGSTFMIYIPAIDQAETHVGKGDKPRLSKRTGETLLIVDDEPSILELSCQLLKHFGYRVFCAESGEKALDIFREKNADIDLVVLDLNMPGMGGRKCLMEMFKIDPEARVAITSGYSAAAKAKDLLEHGAVGFIGKPYELEGLLSQVRTILDEQV